jgi:hypothetical protein
MNDKNSSLFAIIVGNLFEISSEKTSLSQFIPVNINLFPSDFNFQDILKGFQFKSQIANFFPSLISFNRISSCCTSFSSVNIIQFSDNFFTNG